MRGTKPDISIIGAGVVGTALGACAAKAGYKVAAIASRQKSSAEAAARVIGGSVEVCLPAEAAARAQLLLLTVPDDAIAPVAAELADAKAVRPGTFVAHCSGALTSEVLEPLAQQCGALTASMHPLQTFPNVQAAIEEIPHCHCFCEGEPRALSAVMQLAGDVGCVPMEISPDRKTLYHAAACIACNYLATLQEAAIAAASFAEVPRQAARNALAPLVAATVKNIAFLDTAPALTGPIARGDVQTVRRHLVALDAVDKELAELYRQLGRRTVKLALQGGKIDAATAERLLQLLQNKG